MSELTIEVQPREATGKNANRRLRAAGLVPAVVYGGGKDAIPIQLDRAAFLGHMRSMEGHNPIFLLKLGGTGKSRHAMIRDMQVDPVSRRVMHIDFQRILMTEKIRVSVDVELVGVPTGVRNEGGVLDFVTREIEIECLPSEIPTKFELDVTDLHMNQHLEVEDLEIPEGIEVLEDEDRVIIAVVPPKIVEVEEEEEEELLEAEVAEPEVIGRGKEAEEAEEPEEAEAEESA